MTHLTQQDINGYIHRTLTDAQRETMDRHIESCTTCGIHLQAAERLRRDMSYGLADEIRRTRPSQNMRFNKIQHGLNRRRRWSVIHFHSMQMLSTVSVLIALVSLGYFALILMQNAATPGAATVIDEEVLTTTEIVKLFDEDWHDPMPYQGALIETQQSALELLPKLPIYHIEMEVSDDLRHVNGRQQLRYINQTNQTVESLVFHLYPNQTYGMLEVYDVEVNGRPAKHKLLDDDLNLQVTLAKPLPPGGTAVVEMAFVLDIGRAWRIAPQLGQPYHEVTHLVQFHPLLAVYHDNSGWDLTNPSHQLSYNTQPAFYRVQVVLPTAKSIIGSGAVTGRELVNNGNAVREAVTLAAGPVDEFYLTISDQFEVAVSDMVGGTRINSYAQSQEQMEEAQKALEYTRTAVALYNEQFGEYPFTELDVVNMQSLAFARQGIAFSGVLLLEHDRLQYTLESQENVMLFLVASQWFDPIISTTRLQNPWLTDGLAEYASRYYYNTFFAPSGSAQLEAGWENRVLSKGVQAGLPAAGYSDLAYFNTMHGRVPMFLTAVADEMGEETWDAFLRDYVQTYRWLGADAATFKRLAEQHCQCDLSSLFAEWGLTPNNTSD